jgi:glycosyltransferase involved in cell wall biosynthesis
MKIGIVVDNELNNDIRVLREIEILKNNHHGIFVLCFGFLKTYRSPADQINITRINIHRRLRDVLFFFLNTIPAYEWLWMLQIKKFIIRNNIEILHVHDLYMARASHKGIIKADSKIRLILDLHENYPYTVTTYNWTKGLIRSSISKPEEWAKKEHEYMSYADKIIVLSNEFRDLLIKKYPGLEPETFVVLPNVPNLAQPEYNTDKVAVNPFKNNYPILFYYGVIAERRGIFDSLEVFISLVKENHEVNFLLIGPVDKKDKSRFLNYTDLDLLADRIHYIPWIESKEFPAYLAICDICLAPFHKNPQHESGVANKIYDYMLGSKPVIASDCKPQQDLIEKHNCGIIFGNITEFHDAIIKLINDKPLREEMGERGRKTIMEEYNTRIVEENIIKLYENITFRV